MLPAIAIVGLLDSKAKKCETLLNLLKVLLEKELWNKAVVNMKMWFWRWRGKKMWNKLQTVVKYRGIIKRLHKASTGRCRKKIAMKTACGAITDMLKHPKRINDENLLQKATRISCCHLCIGYSHISCWAKFSFFTKNWFTTAFHFSFIFNGALREAHSNHHNV